MSTYHVIARNEGRYWAVTLDGFEAWGEATAWQVGQIEDRAIDLIVKETGMSRDRIEVRVSHRIGRRR